MQTSSGNADDDSMNEHPLARPWWLLPLGRLHAWWWIGIAGVLLWADYVTGPKTEFPVVYVIPVTVAAWYSGRWPATALAITLPLVHTALLATVWHQPWSTATLAATAIRGAVVVAMALWFARLAEHERALRRHVRTLEGLLPICAFCKRIRNEAGAWERLETYIAKRSAAQFSHGFCPSCWQAHYAELGEAPPE